MDGVSGGAERGGWGAGSGLSPRLCVWGCAQLRGAGRSGTGVTVWTQLWPPTVHGRQLGVWGGEREDDGDLAEREVRPSLERGFAASGGLVRGSGAGCLRRERWWE